MLSRHTAYSSLLPYTCLTYCMLPFGGHGWPQTCVNVLAEFPKAGVQPVLALPRWRKHLPPAIRAFSSLSFPRSALPWRCVADRGLNNLRSLFIEFLDQANPDATVAYFWPGTPSDLVRHARSKGILTIREMINCCLGTAKPILDSAYHALDLPPGHTITAEAVDRERAELSLYDYVFASSENVEASLLEAGIDRSRIIPAFYSWAPDRFPNEPAIRSADFTLLFVGLVCVRKGVLTLLEAWRRSGVEGSLCLVGSVEPAIADLVQAAVAGGTVKHIPFTSNVGSFYRSSDVFVLPTLEEGGPQVTLEAGGCGLPVITTPMGRARLVTNEVNGLLVNPNDVDGLASAIRRLAVDHQLRRAMALQIAHDANTFTSDRVSILRANALVERMQQRLAARWKERRAANTN